MATVELSVPVGIIAIGTVPEDSWLAFKFVKLAPSPEKYGAVNVPALLV